MATIPNIIVNTPNKDKTLLDYVFPIALVIGGGIGLKLAYDNFVKNKEEKKIGEKGHEDTTAANTIVNALNPSGYSFLKQIDGTNAKEIFDAVRDAINSGKKLSDINAAYKKLTGSDFYTDMKRDLDSEQYNTLMKFAMIVSTRPMVNMGDIIVSKAAVITRKTPYINGTPRLIDRRGNSIDIVDTNHFIGTATGNQYISVSRDTLLAAQQTTATLFYEVKAGDLKRNKYNVWVAASQVKVLPNTTANAKGHKMYYLDTNNWNKAEALQKPYLQ